MYKTKHTEQLDTAVLKLNRLSGISSSAGDEGDVNTGVRTGVDTAG